MIMKQTFRMRDGITLTLPVIYQRSKQIDAKDIQISVVVDVENLELTSSGAVAPFRFIYEEISRDGTATYARFVASVHVFNHFRWAIPPSYDPEEVWHGDKQE